MKKLIIAGVAFTMIALACTKNATNSNITVDCSGGTKSFTADVNPAIQSTCTASNCHGSGSRNGPGELLTYSQIFNARSAIRSAILSGAMPRNTSLSATEINNIICWIDNGATNN